MNIFAIFRIAFFCFDGYTVLFTTVYPERAKKRISQKFRVLKAPESHGILSFLNIRGQISVLTDISSFCCIFYKKSFRQS